MILASWYFRSDLRKYRLDVESTGYKAKVKLYDLKDPDECFWTHDSMMLLDTPGIKQAVRDYEDSFPNREVLGNL